MGEVYGPFSSSGEACSSAPLGSAAPIPCKPGQFTGQIHGADVCVTASGTQSAPSTITAPSSGSASAATSGIANAPPTAVTAQETTTCEGTSCTTTTEYKNGAGTVVGTRTEAKPQASFCAENPGASICAPEKSECEKDPDTVGCSKYGTPDNSVALAQQDSGFSTVTAVSFTTTESCPASVPFDVFGHSYAIGYSGICSTLTDYIKPIILLLGAAAAAFIFANSFKV